MKIEHFGALFLLIKSVNGFAHDKQENPQKETAMKRTVGDVNRLKRQNGYGMWNNAAGGGGNFPMGNWNGPNPNEYRGSQERPPDDSIKGSVGVKEEKPTDQNQNQNKDSNSNISEGEGFWPPNNGYGQNGYNNGPLSNGNLPFANGYNNRPLPFNGNNNNDNINDGIKGSVGTAAESTRAPQPPYGYVYGNNFGNGYGNHAGFNRMASGGGSGYNNRFGRPILPRGERFVNARRSWIY